MNHEALRDYEGAKLGMWLFLFTEILLFGGLFILFSLYMHRYPTEFYNASQELDVLMGSINTVVLISSSLLVALAISALMQGKTVLSRHFLVWTIVCAGLFLVIKYFEWSGKYHHGIWPATEMLAQRPQGEQIYFALYFAMTGLHGLHVLIGMAVLGWVYWLIGKGSVTPEYFVTLENAGLYWHLVDLIWIYLFPLFYLVA